MLSASITTMTTSMLLLGALTGKEGIDGKQVGKIQIFDNRAFVAIDRKVTKTAFKKLSEGELKGRSFKVRQLHG